MQVADGVYSIAAIGISGASLIVVRIADGLIFGNDSSGARYEGAIADAGPGEVNISFSATFAPKTFGIWGISPSETFQTRNFDVVVPAGLFSREPYELPEYGMTVLGTRIPDERGWLADVTGFADHIFNLIEVQQAWQGYDRQKSEPPA